MPLLPTDLVPDSRKNYSIVAWARGQDVLYYQTFGSYQGEWIMLSRDKEQYFVWKGSFGSCSGCDSYKAEIRDYSDNPLTREKALKFAEDYHSFIEIPRSTMRNLAKSGNLAQCFPLNIRDSYGDIPYDQCVRDMQTLARLEENVPCEPQDVFETHNQEIKRRALEAIGPESFMERAKAEVLDASGEEKLVRFDATHVYVYVKDASTPRRYLLRVPPETKTLRGGVAWTFGLTAEQYQPLEET